MHVNAHAMQPGRIPTHSGNKPHFSPAAYPSRLARRRRCMRRLFPSNSASPCSDAVCEQSPRLSGPPHSFLTSSCGRRGEEGMHEISWRAGRGRGRASRLSPAIEASETAKAAVGTHPMKQVPTKATCPASCFLLRCSNLHRPDRAPIAMR